MRKQEAGLLQFFLLGAPQLLRNGNLVSGFITRKAEALLFYLAVTGRPHTRAALAALLWPDMPEQNARKNLRDVIVSLRKTVGEFLLITNQTLALDPARPYWVDAINLSNVLHEPKVAALDDLREALGLYHGEFLEGFYAINALPFDEWTRQKREEYYVLVLNGLHNLADRYLAANEFDAGLTATRRLLLLDPWNEEAHRKQMLLLAEAGQRSAALAQYQTCVQVLADELQVEPMPETTALYVQIRDGLLTHRRPTLAEETEISSSRSDSAAVAPERPPPIFRLPHNLPRQLTPLVGREHESAAVRNKLFDPNYPLVTIVGEGGVGKTRLALAVAQSIADGAPGGMTQEAAWKTTWPLGNPPSANAIWARPIQFYDGIWFVPLADVVPGENLHEQLAGAIGAGLGLTFVGSKPPKTQLFDHLAGKSLLLVLDNFEHLNAGVGFLVELLQRVHHLTLLVTSRHRLNLQAEYVYRLEGLPVPEQMDSDSWHNLALLDYASVQLFLERAERNTAGFVLTPENQGQVLTICQFVEGLPLGIELAAALVEHHTVARIARTLTENYTLLAADLGDLLPRHRSISTVLDYSWQLLTEDEAQILACCSVFRGGFTRDAAAAVAGAQATHLEALAQKSLLRYTDVERFDLHELVRHYAAERLDAQPAISQAVTSQHGIYYIDLLYANQEQLAANRQTAATMRLELDNLRAAWVWAVQVANAEMIAKGLDGLMRCYETAGHYREGEALLRQAVNRFQAQSTADSTHLLARLRLAQGFFCLKLGLLDDAEMLYQHAMAEGRRHNDPLLLARVQVSRSLLMLLRGNYKAALAIGQEARQWAQSGGFGALEGTSLNHIGIAYDNSGQREQAKACFEQALQLTKRYDNKEAEALLLINLGELYQKAGNFAEALQCHQQALFLLRRLDKQPGIAVVLQYLGSLLMLTGSFVQARVHFLQALEIFQGIEDRYYEELILTKLSNLFYQLKLYEKAETYGEQAIHLATTAGHQSIHAEALLYRGRLLTVQHQFTAAAAAYNEALMLWQESGQSNWALAAQAELARLAYLHHDYVGALTIVKDILAVKAELTSDFSTDCFVVDWVCYQVLTANGDARAQSLLENSYRQLQMQAATITDEALHQSFLEKVPVNRAIADAFQAKAHRSSGQQVSCCPCSSATKAMTHPLND